jgi:peptidoglycan LD-endopeptidase LytH
MRRCLLLVPIALVAVTSLAVPAVAGATTSGTTGSDNVHNSGSTTSKKSAKPKKSKKSAKSKKSKKSKKNKSTSTRTPSGGGMHIVARGDSVPSVARRYGVSADDIRAANGIVDDRLFVGARLIIDGSASSGAAPATTSGSVTVLPMQRASSTTYRVKQGDVFERVARKHGVSLKALLKANGLKSTSLVLPGETLVIPSGSSQGPAGGSGASVASRPAGATGPSLRCPVRGATFMNDWGFPRDGGTRFHEGTDLFAPKGTTIVAPASGTIAYGSNNLGGSTFTIRTADGWEIYGAHISAAIGSSRTVRQGEPIARVGNSGDANGGDYHLHLGVKRAGGRPQNPYPSVLAACR